MPCTAPPCGMTPSSTATPEVASIAPPTTPTSAMRRPTRPDRNISQPRISPVPTPSAKPGPSRNVQLCMETSDLPIGTTDAAFALLVSVARVATVRRLRRPTAMKPHSTRRAVT